MIIFLVIFYQDEGNQTPKNKRDKSKRQIEDIGLGIERVNQRNHCQQVREEKNKIVLNIVSIFPSMAVYV